MSFKLKFYRKADKEFLAAYKWYEEQLPDLGKRFQEEVDNQVKRIIASPENFPFKAAEFQEAVLDVFPFIIVFKVYPERNIIVIASVFHTSRNPRKKLGR